MLRQYDVIVFVALRLAAVLSAVLSGFNCFYGHPAPMTAAPVPGVAETRQIVITFFVRGARSGPALPVSDRLTSVLCSGLTRFQEDLSYFGRS